MPPPVVEKKIGGGGLAGFGNNQILKNPNGSDVNDCPSTCHEWCIDDVVDELKECEESIYVNLNENRETFTAYEGAAVWNAIYAENCDCTDSATDQKEESE